MKYGDTLAINIALLPIVFPQMMVCFSAYISYDWDFIKAGVVSNISQCQITLSVPSRVRDLAKSRAPLFIYLISISSVTVTVRFKLSLIHISESTRPY